MRPSYLYNRNMYAWKDMIDIEVTIPGYLCTVIDSKVIGSNDFSLELEGNLHRCGTWKICFNMVTSTSNSLFDIITSGYVWEKHWLKNLVAFSAILNLWGPFY